MRVSRILEIIVEFRQGSSRQGELSSKINLTIFNSEEKSSLIIIQVKRTLCAGRTNVHVIVFSCIQRIYIEGGLCYDYLTTSLDREQPLNSVFSHGAEISGASHPTPECSSCSSYSYCASVLQTNGLLKSPNFWYPAFSYNIQNEVPYGFGFIRYIIR